jgi:hypothetical protein
VALAGDDHVVVAVVAHLRGPPRERRDHRAGAGERVALAFLAAEAAAHAPHLDADGVHRKTQRLGHLVLDLGRVLGGGMDDHVAPLLREGERGLPFEVEVLLPADLEPAFDGDGRRRHGGGRVAAPVDAGAVLVAAVRGQRCVDGEERGEFAIPDTGEPDGAARREVRGRGDDEDRLSHVVDAALGEKRFVPGRGRDVVLVREVTRREDHGDPGRGAHGVEVQRRDLAVRHGGKAEGEVERVGRDRDVVDVARLTGDVETGGIVRKCTRDRVLGEGVGDGHARTSSTRAGTP